jgi:hypothetical protein
MKKILFSLLFLLVFLQVSNAQRSKLLYLELGGNAFIYSLNYDARFGKTNHGLGFRIGTSLLGEQSYHTLIFPTHLNYVLGKKNYGIELGVGGIAIFQPTAPSDKNHYYPSAVVAYRYQPTDKHFSFRIGWMPTFIKSNGGTFDFSPLLRYMPGLSFGYRL